MKIETITKGDYIIYVNMDGKNVLYVANSDTKLNGSKREVEIQNITSYGTRGKNKFSSATVRDNTKKPHIFRCWLQKEDIVILDSKEYNVNLISMDDSIMVHLTDKYHNLRLLSLDECQTKLELKDNI